MPESALLLMVAAVWLEYPESLWRSMLTTFSAAGFSLPRSEWWERFAATLAAGDLRNASGGAGRSSSEMWSSTVGWRLRAAMVGGVVAEVVHCLRPQRWDGTEAKGQAASGRDGAISIRLKRALRRSRRVYLYGARREQEGARMASRVACGLEAAASSYVRIAGWSEMVGDGGGGGEARGEEGERMGGQATVK